MTTIAAPWLSSPLRIDSCAVLAAVCNHVPVQTMDGPVAEGTRLRHTDVLGEKSGKIELAEVLSNRGVPEMCDYSLQSIKSRPAKIGDKLTTRDFGTGTRGFAASENPSVAVCVLPGTEVAFAHEVKRLPTRLWPWHDSAIRHRTAIFRQINKDKVAAHHDALEFPDGQIVLLTLLAEDQQATILQLPAEPKTAVEAESQKRAAYVG